MQDSPRTFRWLLRAFTFTGLDEFAFITVLALPNASSNGLTDIMFVSSLPGSVMTSQYGAVSNN